MPGFEAELEHGLSREVAFSRLQQFGERMRAAYSDQVSELTEVWHEDGRFEFSFKVMGLSIKGDMVTCEERVRVQGSLPFAALPFRGQLENEIRTRLLEALQAEEA